MMIFTILLDILSVRACGSARGIICMEYRFHHAMLCVSRKEDYSRYRSAV